MQVSLVSTTVTVFLVLSLAQVNSERMIHSPLVTAWGQWGNIVECPIGQYVYGMSLKTEWAGGDSTLKGIKLYCTGLGKRAMRDPDTFMQSGVGKNGKWDKAVECETAGFAVGFSLRQVKREGTEMANNIMLKCDSGKTMAGAGLSLGEGSWTSMQHCRSDEYVCGLQSHVQMKQFGKNKGDVDVYLNNINLKCC